MDPQLPELSPTVVYVDDRIEIHIHKGDMKVEKVTVSIDGALLHLRELTVAIHRAIQDQNRKSQGV